MPPNVPPTNDDPSKVWVSREEYERLRQMDNNRPAAFAPNPVTINADPHSVSDNMAKEQKILALVLALGLLLALTVSGLQVLAIVIAPIFFLFGLVSIVDYHRQRKRESGDTMPLPPGVRPSVLKRLLVITGIVLLIPVIGYALFIGFILVALSVSGGPSS